MSRGKRVSTRVDTMPAYVSAAIAKGDRPFLTATIAAETYLAIDELCKRLRLSRGRCIDRAIDALQRVLEDE